MSSGSARNTLRDQPGSLDDSECHHRGQLPQDPPTEFTQHCQEDAVFAVPHPNGLGQCIALCSWHLARYFDAYPEKRDSLTERFTDLEDHLPDTSWLGLDDLPNSTEVDDEDDRWQLFALDQRGHAYYAPTVHAPAEIAVYADGDWEHLDEAVSPPKDASTRDICEHIADVHGLAALPSDVVDAVTATRGGRR